jgi:GxxExxY protein
MTRITRMKEEIIHEELSGEIIGAAMDVLNELKPALDEKLYERALVIELRRRGHTVDAQRSYPVFYNSEQIGHLLPDLIVDDTVIVDPKVVSAFNEAYTAQMIGVPCDQSTGSGPIAEFQKCPIGVETRRAAKQNGV